MLPIWLQLLFPDRSAAAVPGAWASPLRSTLRLCRAAIVCSHWAHTAGWHVEGWRHNLQLLPSLPGRQLSVRHHPSGSLAVPSPLCSFFSSQVVSGPPSVSGPPCRASHGAGRVQRPQWWILPSDFLPWSSNDSAGPQESWGLLAGAGGLLLSQPPPCLSLPLGWAASCLLFIRGQGCLQPRMTQPWSHGGSHVGCPGVPPQPAQGPGLGACSALPREHLLMEQETFGFVFPAPHKWHLQDSGIPGSPWLCRPRSPCPGAAHQALDRGTWMGPPLKETGCKGAAQPCTDCTELTQSFISFLQRGNCCGPIKWWVTVRARPTRGDPKPTDLNRRTCMALLKLSGASLTPLNRCCRQLPIPNTAAALLTFRGPGSVILLWVWSRWREQGRREKGAMAPICKERQGWDQPQAWPWLTSCVLNG